VLMLVSRRGRTNGPAFALGWIVGLAALGAIVLSISSGAGASDGGEPATWASVLKLVLGALLLLVGVKQWRGRPREQVEATTPNTAIAGTGISTGQQVAAYALCVVVATIGVGAPVVLSIVMGDRSRKLLDEIKDWMGQNNAVIMAVLMLLLGVKLIGDGISGL